MSVAIALLAHLLASLVVVGTMALVASAGYFGLLGWAIVRNEGLGGPLALPFLAVTGAAVGLALSLGLFLPSTAGASAIAKRRRLGHPGHLFTLGCAWLVVGAVAGACLPIDNGGGRALAAGVSAIAVFALGAQYWLVRAFVEASVEALIRVYRPNASAHRGAA